MVATPSALAQTAPSPAASAWILVDAGDGKVLAADDPDERLPIASTTKLMTAYLALHRLRPSERLTAPDYRAKPAESLLGLEPGEADTVHDLLYGLLLPSGNDAAVDLADGVAGSVPAFVSMMNAAAGRLGLHETHYSTPVGLDDPANYSTARDLAKLAGILLRNPLFRRIVDTPRATLRSGAEVRHVANTNTLLRRVPFVDGVKTGTTDLAGDVLVSSGTRHGVTLVAVVLGAPDEATRDAGSLALLRYGFSRYSERAAVRRDEVVRPVSARFTSTSLPLAADRTIRVYSRRDQPLRLQASVPHRVIGPIAAGSRLGTVKVSLEGQPSGHARLEAAEFLPAPVDPATIERSLPGDPGRATTTSIGLALFVAGVGMAGLAALSGRREA